jgi:Fe-S-cluster-containing dehydrogenase component/CRP-like cAMP-binding protein
MLSEHADPVASAAGTVAVESRRRWDQAFGNAPLDDGEVERVLALSPFQRLDAARFGGRDALADLIRNETRIVTCERGDLLFRAGDYGTSAYLIVRGIMHLASGAPDSLLAEVEMPPDARRLGLLAALAQLGRRNRWPEVRRDQLAAATAAAEARRVRNVDAVLATGETRPVGPGEFFGELSALARTPRTASVFCVEPAELVEIRWQGLRDLCRRAPSFHAWVDSAYRERALQAELIALALLRHLDPEQLRRVREETIFESYGEREWALPYRELAGSEPAARLAGEPVVAAEGDYPNGVLLVRSGCGRLSVREGSSERTVGYLNRGRLYGLDEIVRNWRGPGLVPLRQTLRAVGHLDVLLIPTAVMEEVVLPTLGAEQLPAWSAPASTAQSGSETPGRDQRTSLLEFLVDRRLINGTAAMVIDLERCTRCDDCVRACQTTHQGDPRFLREGPSTAHLQVANACMHCVDPVCMIGCPTGAIHRERSTGVVVIDDRTCIGCGTCANNCPYQAIRMVEVRDERGALLVDAASGTPILRATKCDLCFEQRTGPACANACPHDALARVDLTDSDGADRLLGR